VPRVGAYQGDANAHVRVEVEGAGEEKLDPRKERRRILGEIIAGDGFVAVTCGAGLATGSSRCTAFGRCEPKGENVIAFDYGFDMLGKRSQANFGTCFGLPADTYVVQVYVGAAPSAQLGDCKTGYLGQYWALEVEEVY